MVKRINPHKKGYIWKYVKNDKLKKYKDEA